MYKIQNTTFTRSNFAETLSLIRIRFEVLTKPIENLGDFDFTVISCDARATRFITEVFTGLSVKLLIQALCNIGFIA